MERLKPTKRQLEFLDWEMGVFFHFGIRTFYEGRKDWDGLDMPPEAFNPANLNCDQWIQAIKVGGAKYAVLTAKHGDGFANWPSAFTEYSVKNTPWKNGNGDVVREYVDACRKHDIKVGLYYSPAQVGYQFQNSKDYDDYFINQISELLGNYGEIDYLWFDGYGSEGHKYDENRIIDVIRKLQPNILIFNMWDPDVNWIGNEEGIAPCGSRNVVTSTKLSINETEVTGLKEEKFLPFECDLRIRREKWFYSDNDLDQLRSLGDLMGVYYYTVGRGGNMLLNIAPNRQGILPKPDCERYKQFGDEIKKRFSNPIPHKVIKEGNRYTLKLGEHKQVNCIVLQEDLQDGESIEEFNINHFRFIDMVIYQGKVVGHKQICVFPEIYTEQLSIDITKSNGDFHLENIGLYYIQ